MWWWLLGEKAPLKHPGYELPKSCSQVAGVIIEPSMKHRAHRVSSTVVEAIACKSCIQVAVQFAFTLERASADLDTQAEDSHASCGAASPTHST